MAALLTVLVAVSVTAWFFFTLGRSTAPRSVTRNHHKMMMLLVDLRNRDDSVPSMTSVTRRKLDHLLGDYEAMDLSEER